MTRMSIRIVLVVKICRKVTPLKRFLIVYTFSFIVSQSYLNSCEMFFLVFWTSITLA